MLIHRSAGSNYTCGARRFSEQEGTPGSALHICAVEAYEYLAQLLLDHHGGDVSLRIHLGMTPLHLFVVVRRHQMVKLLKTQGADIFAPRDQGKDGSRLRLIDLNIDRGTYTTVRSMRRLGKSKQIITKFTDSGKDTASNTGVVRSMRSKSGHSPGACPGLAVFANVDALSLLSRELYILCVLRY